MIDMLDEETNAPTHTQGQRAMSNAQIMSKVNELSKFFQQQLEALTHNINPDVPGPSGLQSRNQPFYSHDSDDEESVTDIVDPYSRKSQEADFKILHEAITQYYPEAKSTVESPPPSRCRHEAKYIPPPKPSQSKLLTRYERMQVIREDISQKIFIVAHRK